MMTSRITAIEQAMPKLIPKLKPKDFEALAGYLDIPDKVYSRILEKFGKSRTMVVNRIHRSQLTDEARLRASEIINERYDRIFR